FRRMIERHGENAGLRGALLRHPRLPSDCRHMLVVRVGDVLKRSTLLQRSIGAMRAERVTRDACVRASLTLIDGTATGEHPALVEHLRLSGELTPSFLIRAVAHGKIDFLGASLIALTGQSEHRVRALLANGQDLAVSALLRAAGLA